MNNYKVIKNYKRAQSIKTRLLVLPKFGEQGHKKYHSVQGKHAVRYSRSPIFITSAHGSENKPKTLMMIPDESKLINSYEFFVFLCVCHAKAAPSRYP